MNAPLPNRVRRRRWNKRDSNCWSPPRGTLPPATTPILLLAGLVTDTRGVAHPAARRQSAFLNPVVRCIGPITNERHPHVRGSRRPYRSRAVGDNENFEPLTEPLFSTAAMNFPAISPDQALAVLGEHGSVPHLRSNRRMATDYGLQIVSALADKLLRLSGFKWVASREICWTAAGVGRPIAPRPRAALGRSKL